MPELFLPDAETAYTRTVLLAVELLDAVTLEPVSRGVRVSAPPLAYAPIVSASGRFVWLLAGPQRPQRVLVDAGALPYDSEEIDAPPLPDPLLPATPRLMRIWLRPRRGYLFADGVMILRGSLAETIGAPPVPVEDAEVWLEWQDEVAGTWLEQRARSFTRTRGGGEFAVFLRLVAPDQPLLEGGLMQVRIGVRRPGGALKYTAPLAARQGQARAALLRLAWDHLEKPA
jgi:hypothetical protein